MIFSISPYKVKNLISSSLCFKLIAVKKLSPKDIDKLWLSLLTDTEKLKVKSAPVTNISTLLKIYHKRHILILSVPCVCLAIYINMICQLQISVDNSKNLYYQAHLGLLRPNNHALCSPSSLQQAIDLSQ